MATSAPCPALASQRPPRSLAGRAVLGLGVLGLVALLAACANLGYYTQAVHGHARILQAARPVDDWLSDPGTSAQLRERLVLAQQLRDFATQRLALPDNASYRRYAALQGPYPVWNVVAAPPDALQPKRWCFVVVGCVAYRGYYDAARAHALAEQLQTEHGLETHVYGVPAYSTLGRLNWAGGDPLLSSFVHGPVSQLAGLLFHELAHQQVYVRDDTVFNESYATAVQRLGLTEWMHTHASAQTRQEHAAWQARRRDWTDLTHRTRRALDRLYAHNGTLSVTELQARKADTLARFRRDYARLRSRWLAQGLNVSASDAWVAGANNASFALLATYDTWVPAFEALFHQVGGDWPVFHARVQQLGDLSKDQRRTQLQALQEKATP